MSLGIRSILMCMLMFGFATTVMADIPADFSPDNLGDKDELFTPEHDAWISLADLGYESGWTFDGLESGHLHTFHFPLPRLSGIEAATLRLGHTTIPGLNAHSLLRVEINEQPLHALPLSGDNSPHWLEVPIPAEMLAHTGHNFANLTVRASLALSDDRCEDERATAAFLHIAPSSGLRLTLTEAERSIAGAWERLPREVTLSLPAQVDEATFVTALTLFRHFESEGRNVHVVRLPQTGDITIASHLELSTAVADLPGGIEALERTDPNANAWLIELPEQTFIALPPSTGTAPAGLLHSGWAPLARERSADILHAATTPARLPATLEEASFALLGADIPPQDVVRSAEWTIPLGPQHIPAGRVPSLVRLVVTSAPVPEDNPMMLYAYIGNVLHDVHRLQGGTEHVTLHLTKAATQADGDLHLVTRRDGIGGDCRSPLAGYPVQISPSSSIVFSPGPKTPADFGDLPRHFAAGADLVLDPTFLEQPASALPFISRLMHANRYPLHPEHVRFTRDLANLDHPFILIAENPTAVDTHPVHFDRGQITIRNEHGETLLDMGAPAALTVAQMVENNGQHGLWIKPPSSNQLPDTPTKTLALTFDKIAFIDDRGIALSLSPDHTDFARVDYPEHRDWLDTAATYRYWLMALGWLLLAALLAHLYVKVRSHKKVR